MLKKFILKKREEEQLTDTQGTMSFHIDDENGISRVVTGVTYLNEEKIAQGITTDNKRELPLIEGLFRMKVDEVIDVEFDAYNKMYLRDLDKTVNQVAYDTVLEMEKEKKLLYRLGKLISSNKFLKSFSASKKTAT